MWKYSCICFFFFKKQSCMLTNSTFPNVALRRSESWGQEVLCFSRCIRRAFPLRRTCERKVSLCSSEGEPFNSKKQSFNSAPCTTVHSIHNGEDRVTCYFRPNMTANNCLTNICMSLSVLLNTLLSNWAPRVWLYFKLFADSTLGWNKTIMNHISHHHGVLRGFRFHWKLDCGLMNTCTNIYTCFRPDWGDVSGK